MVLECKSCKQPMPLPQLALHESQCQKGVCSNQLCLQKLTNPATIVQFKCMNLTGEPDSFVACSKKCKKVTKFQNMLKHGANEQQILVAFETLLRKKLNPEPESAGSKRSAIDFQTLQ